MNWFRGMLTAGAGLVLTASAPAAVMTISGGDAGQGLTLDPDRVIHAVHFGGGATTIQGVSFVADNGAVPGVGRDGYSNYPYPNPFGAGETSDDDNALKGLLMSGGYFYQSFGKFVISGLTPQAEYQVEVLAAGGGGRTMTVAYNYGPVVDTQAIANGVAYNFNNLVQAGNDGTLVVNLDTGGVSNPVFSGLVVSNPVPEPATLAVVAVGGMMLAARRRRHA